MATTFAGLRGTGDWGTSERPQNFREMILWLNPAGSAPLFALMAKARKQSTNDPQFHWWEEKNQNMIFHFGTGYTTGDTTVTLYEGAETDPTSDANNALGLVVGDVMSIEPLTQVAAYANELVVVSSITSSTVIVIKRGQAGSTAGDIGDGAILTKIGTANEEGASSPNVALRNPTKLTNYTQIFKTAVEETLTAAATFARTGNSWDNDKKRKSFDHSRDIEWSMMFGQAYEDTSGTKPKRYMGGLREFITTNNTVFTTSPTEDTFLNAVSPVFDYTKGGSGDERIMLAGNGFLNELNKLARNSSSSRINFDGYINLYGMKLQRWILPQGTVAVKGHPLMSTHERFKYSSFIIDPQNILWRPLRDTRFKDNIQDNDEDVRKGQWLTEAGIEVQFEETMGYIGNFII